jgi:hypothetical protein
MEKFVKISWSNECDDFGILYKETGFVNTFHAFFDNDHAFNPPEYKYDKEGNQNSGRMLSTRSLLFKEYKLCFDVPEELADSLSLIPLHDHVYIEFQDGTQFQCTGDDVLFNITDQKSENLTSFATDEKYHHYTTSVELAIRVDVIDKAQCCTPAILQECSDVVPTISAIVDDGSHDVHVEGTCPDGMFIRTKYKKIVKDVAVTGGISEVSIVSSSLAFAAGSTGGIYKSVNGGNTWTLVGNTGAVLMGIYAVDANNIWVCGRLSGNCYIGYCDGTNITSQVYKYDYGAGLVPVVGTLMSIKMFDVDYGYVCGTAKTIGKYVSGDPVPWTCIITTIGDPITFHNLDIYDLTTAMFVGTNDAWYFTVNSGAAWSNGTTGLGKDWFSVLSASDTVDANWIIAGADGFLATTKNHGSTWTQQITPSLATAEPITGLSKSLNTDNGAYVFYYCGKTGTIAYRYPEWDIAWTDYYWTVSGGINRIATLDHNWSTRGEYIICAENTGTKTTENTFTNGEKTTFVDYEIDGIVQTVPDGLWTYDFIVETFTHLTDPCEQCVVVYHPRSPIVNVT